MASGVRWLRRASGGGAVSRTYTCGGCDITWNRIDTAHCAACHRTFSSNTWFDAHRSQDGERGTCLDPAAVLTHDGHPRMFLRAAMWGGPPLDQQARERLADIAMVRATQT